MIQMGLTDVLIFSRLTQLGAYVLAASITKYSDVILTYVITRNYFLLGNAATLSWHTILPSLKAAWGKLRRDLFTFSTVTKRTVCLFVSAKHKIKINFGSVPFKMLIPLSISLTSQLHAEGNLPF